MKTVFITTRHETDAVHTDEKNLERARYACEHTMLKGLAPVCPRLFHTDSALDDDIERAQYRTMADSLIETCDEVHQYGASVDAVMAADLATAAKLGKPVKIYNSIGVPKNEWNSVKFKDDPDYKAACKIEGRTL